MGLAGGGSSELGGSATPPGAAFAVAAVDAHAVELQYGVDGDWRTVVRSRPAD